MDQVDEDDPLGSLLQLVERNEDDALRAWQRQHGDVAAAWAASRDASLLMALSHGRTQDELVVLACVRCVRRAVVVVDTSDARRCLDVLDLAERWCRDEVSPARLREAACRLDTWADQRERRALSAQVGQAASAATIPGRCARAVEMAARAMAMAEAGVTTDMRHEQYIRGRTHSAAAEQRAFLHHLAALADVVRGELECPRIF